MRLCLLFWLLSCFILLEIFEWGPVTLQLTHPSVRLTCLSCSKYSIRANGFFLPSWIFKCSSQRLTTKILLLRLNCPFFPVRIGKYSIYLLFISFFNKWNNKGHQQRTQQQKEQLFLQSNYGDKLQFFHNKSSWKPLIYVFGLLSPSTGLKQKFFYRKFQDLPY